MAKDQFYHILIESIDLKQLVMTESLYTLNNIFSLQANHWPCHFSISYQNRATCLTVAKSLFRPDQTSRYYSFEWGQCGSA
ncbi:hypothetical protein P3L10_009947 [Capsicum annuum]